MKTLIGIGCAAIIALFVWGTLVAIGARKGWLHTAPAAKDDTADFLRWAANRYEAESKGNFAIVLLEDGSVAGTYFASHGREVDGNSLFQAASMSKWITAWGVMTLAEKNLIDLDAPVSRHLTRWHLPASEFGNDGVTIRRLLGHTAGLTDGLGFRGFAPEQQLPTVEQELTHAKDALPGANGITRVGAQPGTAWRYSGGGYLMLQILIEEVTGRPFNDYMRRAVLQPLGMTASTFVDPDPAYLADFYNTDGSKAIHYKFTALAAASLYTSAADMTRFLQAQVPGPDGAPVGRGVLTPLTLETMQKPQAFLYGIPVWGLGETLYVSNGAGSYIIGHDGTNYPAINTTARIDPETGDGLVVLETGNGRLAMEIGGEWVFWKTGTFDLQALILLYGRSILIAFLSGALVILTAAAYAAWHGWLRSA